MSSAPTRLTVRTYQVGFGDCFLLTFDYGNNKKHILIDFGTVRLPAMPANDHMTKVALDIQKQCGGKLDAVVATHRHKDHISGFTPAGGKGSGDIIRACKPDLVIQPWTEDPAAKSDATGPVGASSGKGVAIRALAARQATAEGITAEIGRTPRKLQTPAMQMTVAAAAASLSNQAAIKNLQTMAPRQTWVYFGAKSGLETTLPGVMVRVLGPPTLKQSTAIKTESSRNATEFWQLQANALLKPAGGSSVLFPHYVVPGNPLYARWIRRRARDLRADLLFELVRTLDKALNNTSVILLFTIGANAYLFPGDAQLENWQYALSQADVMASLKKVALYKVGHHGSLNATPKSLWNLFDRKSSPAKSSGLQTLVSTLEGVYGSPTKGTEVPRSKLVDALKAESIFFSTQMLRSGIIRHDLTIQL